MVLYIAIYILFLFADSYSCEDIDIKDGYRNLEQKIEQQFEKFKRQDVKIEQQNEQMKMFIDKMQRQEDRIQVQDEEMEILKQEIKRLNTENTLLRKEQQKQRNDKITQENGNDKLITDEEREKRLLIDNPEHLQFEIDQLKSSVQTLTSAKGGALYVQWGRKRCTSNDTETVYSGYAGGSYHDHTGGAAEYVCIPPDPDFGKYIPAAYSTYLYGAEYETNYFGQPWNEDVPCAVCRSITGNSALMIPAKNHCYQDWKVEYRGRLASGYYTHAAASQYVCVDEHPEAIIGGNADRNGKLFYPVVSECGSLPCPPYKNNAELLCVVCSK